MGYSVIFQELWLYFIIVIVPMSVHSCVLNIIDAEDYGYLTLALKEHSKFIDILTL